jgi:nucleoside-triphosphatase THEP1
MVHIITGEINQGKTTRIISIFNENRNGDGFITKKVFGNGGFDGYEIVRLSNGDKMPFINKILSVPDEAFRYGIFSFSQRALNFAEEIIDELLSNNISPVYMDEIGPVELDGKGFCELLRKALHTDIDLYITVRQSCVDAVVKKFNIRKCEISQLKL